MIREKVTHTQRHKLGTTFFLFSTVCLSHDSAVMSFFLFSQRLNPEKKKKNLSTRSECKCWLFVWHITFVLKYVIRRASAGLNIDVAVQKKEKRRRSEVNNARCLMGVQGDGRRRLAFGRTAKKTLRLLTKKSDFFRTGRKYFYINFIHSWKNILL